MAKQQENTQEQSKKTWKERILFQVREFVIVFGGFLLLNNFVIASFMVPTGSMENEVMTGDFLMVNKFIYGGTSPRNIMFTDVRLPWFRLPAFKQVERGDVIVFEFPGMREEVKPEAFTFYLKRCIALSGDTLQIVNRVVYINGKAVPLPRNAQLDNPRILPPSYIDDRIFPPTAQFNEDNYGPIVIPKKNMEIKLSADNFIMWETFIKREGHIPNLASNGIITIDGKQTTSYRVEQNYVFGMGDHRDNSLDCRYWGFIPMENIVGTPMFVYWSWDSNLPIYDIFSKLASVRLSRVGKLID
jgi:signal peptidase I